MSQGDCYMCRHTLVSAFADSTGDVMHWKLGKGETCAYVRHIMKSFSWAEIQLSTVFGQCDLPVERESYTRSNYGSVCLSLVV